MTDILQILKQYWGYDNFRPLQEEIITAVLEKKDTLALLPTGGGKSLCYQVPALVNEGICLVISPLIALMKDQVENLKAKGILAAAIYSGMSQRQIVQTLKNCAYGPYKLLYISPERIQTSLFKEYLPALSINLIAVDEAHCISQWGYDFRPSYLQIADLREEVPDAPVLALTASATEIVQKDICEKLEFESTNVLRQSYERKNLSYSVFKVDSKFARLVDIVKKVEGTSIIYCKSRKRTVEIASLLQMHGITAEAYHAGLQQEVRNARQQNWIDGKLRIMACTNAFGMGIDKADVRSVIHADVPDCLENYYQEAGRAGRDGKKSYAVLLYDEQDILELNQLYFIRFPSVEKIKEAYAALVNFLQIPNYSGQDQTFSFHFETFIRNFKLNSNEALYALKALEQDGWIYFNEKSFKPSTVVFTTTKDQLYEFQNAHSHLEQLVITLLRTYEGIFDFPANISENLLSRLLKKDELEIKQMLFEVEAFHILKYSPQNDEPQIQFRKNRVAINDLRINMELFEKRKTAFIKRIKKIIEYTGTNTCRSQFINNYFGDKKTIACGICDNCLSNKKMELSTEEFNKISTLISHHLSKQALSYGDLILNLKNINKEKARKVIDFLQAENKIVIDENGKLIYSASVGQA
jgi:ATP-dependent DNA helicase RecQ